MTSLRGSGTPFSLVPGPSAAVVVESDFVGETVLMAMHDFEVVNADTVRLVVFNENGQEVFSTEVSG